MYLKGYVTFIDSIFVHCRHSLTEDHESGCDFLLREHLPLNDGRLATFTNSPQVYKLAPLQSRHINANLPQIHTRPTFSCNVLWVSLSEGSMILAINIVSCFSAQHVLACKPSSAPFDEREALSTGALDLSASIDCGVVFWHVNREP